MLYNSNLVNNGSSGFVLQFSVHICLCLLAVCIIEKLSLAL